MPNPKLTAIITALMFIGGSNGANAAYNLAQLQEIERYILSKDCGALLGYLQSNPGIMDGGDLLSQVGTHTFLCFSSLWLHCISAQTGSGNPDVGLQRIY